MNPLIAQLTHRPFPEVADAIRASADAITHAWDTAVRKAMPQMQNLTFDELKDSTPEILICIADALASDDPNVIEELVSRAPAQGLSRFRLNFDVVEVMQEDRLLRSITVQHAEARLDRRMDELESAALHAAIDVMLQRSVIAMVEKQKTQLRTAAETELKFLSFLSHDMNNNLNSVMLTLQVLGSELRRAGGFTDAEESLDARAAGDRRHRRGNAADAGPRKTPAIGQGVAFPTGGSASLGHENHHAVPTRGRRQISQTQRRNQARNGGRIRHRTAAAGAAEPGGQRRQVQQLRQRPRRFDCGTDHDCPVIWVSDDGHGIAPEKIGHIFEAFKRGEIHGQQGLGLGLAIASQAATLLGAHLTVESKVDVGTTFRLTLPQNTPDPMKSPTPNALLAACS